MTFFNYRKKRELSSDEDLLAEFTQSGDLEVLGILYSRYMSLVYGVCLKYLEDHDEAKDGVMQIFEKLIVEIPKQHIENFRNWLHVVTRNFCLMQLRSQKSQSVHLNEWLTESFMFMENNPVLHPIDDEGRETEEALARCIEKLKDEQKECIRQFYYGNKCYSEIAAGMHIDEKKVKSNLQNAKRNLKLCLEEKHVRQE